MVEIADFLRNSGRITVARQIDIVLDDIRESGAGRRKQATEGVEDVAGLARHAGSGKLATVVHRQDSADKEQVVSAHRLGRAVAVP